MTKKHLNESFKAEKVGSDSFPIREFVGGVFACVTVLILFLLIAINLGK